MKPGHTRSHESSRSSANLRMVREAPMLRLPHIPKGCALAYMHFYCNH